MTGNEYLQYMKEFGEQFGHGCAAYDLYVTHKRDDYFNPGTDIPIPPGVNINEIDRATYRAIGRSLDNKFVPIEVKVRNELMNMKLHMNAPAPASAPAPAPASAPAPAPAPAWWQVWQEADDIARETYLGFMLGLAE